MAKTLLLAKHEIADLLDEGELLTALAEGFKAISADRKVSTPARGELTVGDAGHLLLMPAFVPAMPFATKLVAIFPGNTRRDIPSHLGLIVLMDEATGETLALMDAKHITAMRTAGAAALAASRLARPDARVMTILGAGTQGAAHLRLVSPHFDLERIFIGSHRRESAERLAATDHRAHPIDDAEAAIRQSDIVLLCSHAAQPLILEDWVQPGQHISSVGWAPPGGELDPAIAARRSLFVEARVAFAPPPAGCAELAGIDPARGTELGELLLGLKPGRTSADQVTVYKAMGHAIEDMVIANLVYRAALARGAGQLVDF